MSAWLQRLAWLPAALAALLVVSLLIATIAARLPYPYDLEWMEGGMLVHAWRIQHGLPLYAEPNSSFIPYIYPPGYASLLAFLGIFTELGPTLGRSVSVLATLTSAGLISTVVARHGAGPWRWIAGVVAAVIFLGSWLHSGGFMDLVRPDALALALLLGAATLALERSPKWLVAAGLLLCAGFVVKQHIALWGLPIAALVWSRAGWRNALWFGVPSLVAGLLCTGVLSGLSAGHFWTYLVDVPATHPISAPRMWPGVPWEFGSAMPVAGVFVAAWALWRTHRGGTANHVGAALVVLTAVVAALLFSQSDVGSWWSWLGEQVGTAQPARRGVQSRGAWAAAAGMVSVVGLASTLLLGLMNGSARDWRWTGGMAIASATLLASFVMRGHQGGYINVHMPLHALTSVAAGLAAADVARQRAQYRPVAVAVVSLLLTAQLTTQLSAWVSFEGDTVRWPWERWAPNVSDRAVGDQIVARLAQDPGPIWSPYAPWLAVQAGHAPSTHLIALWDVDTRRHPNGPYPQARTIYMKAVRAHHWSIIVDSHRNTDYGVAEHYPVQHEIPALYGAFRSKTGWPVRAMVLRTPAASGGVPKVAPRR